MQPSSSAPLSTAADSAPGPADAVSTAPVQQSVFTLIQVLQASAAGFLMGVIGFGLIFLMMRPAQPPPIELQPPPTPLPTPTAVPTATPAPVVVYVSGAVTAPGLYTLPVEARVGDALAAAGGLTEDAALFAINQAEKVWDGAQVHVPALLPEAESGTGAVAAEPAAGVSGSAPALAAPAAPSAASGLIDVNNASLDELTSLPGIGPAKAEAIIANRPYASVDDLERAPGIGAKTIEQLRNLVTAGP